MGNSILLTGGTGKLGNKIIESKLFSNLLFPTREEFDLTSPQSINNYFMKNEIGTVIHCAALARLSICHKKPNKAIETNIIGTSNIINEVLRIQEKSNRNIRFVHISTDGVYSSNKGNYSEKDKTLPYSVYGWTKLASEKFVELLNNYCIIRTRFFDPDNIPFSRSATDIYTSSMPIKKLVCAIETVQKINYVGVINIGDLRLSDFERYKAHKPEMKPCTRKDILEGLPFKVAKDASMDCSLWHSLTK